MTTSTRKTQIARDFKTALKNQDFDFLKTLVTEDVVWSLPASSLVAGKASGIDAVIKLAQDIVSYGLEFGIQHILFGQNGVALSLHTTATKGELVLDQYLATVLVLRSYKIVAINTYMSNVQMANNFCVST